MPFLRKNRAQINQSTLVLSAILLGSCADPTHAPTVGAPIPEIELPDLKGNTFRVSELRGKVVLVNFWASWCPPCVEEMPSLEKLHRTLHEKGLEVVAVSVDESLEVIERFRKENDLSFTILHDRGARVSQRFQTFKYPETYVVDREGHLVTKIIGPQDWISPNVMLEVVGLLKSGNQNRRVE